MTEHDDPDYEEQLRRVLRQVPSPRADADTVLERVQTGARRRVRRRRVGGAVASVAALATAVLVVVPAFDDHSNVADGPNGTRTQQPSQLHSTELQKRETASLGGKRPGGRTTADRATLEAGEVTKATDVAVSDIALSAQGELNVIGEGSCADGPCLVTGSQAAGIDFRVAPTKDRLLRSMTWKASSTTAPHAGIQVGTDESNSWAWTDAFYASHDAGETWKPVRLPDAMSVNDVQAAGGRVWAFGSRPNGRPVVASSVERRDDWVAEAAPVSANETITSPMAVGDDVAFVASQRNSNRSSLVRREGNRWVRRPAPCPQPVESTTADDTVWLGCRKPDGFSTVARSRNGGKTWQSTPIKVPSDVSAVGGADSTKAVVSAGKKLYMLDEAGVTTVGAPFTGDDVWKGKPGYTSIRFDADGTGYATTTGGALARSDNGGTEWNPESLP